MLDSHPADGRAGLQAAVLHVSDRLEELSIANDNANLDLFTGSVAELRSCCSKVVWSSSTEQAEDAWGHACALWNAAVDASNKGLVSSSKTAAVQVAWLRHMACELLHAVPAGLVQEFRQLQLINFCLRASTAWCELDMWEQSDVVLTFAVKAADTACSGPLQRGVALPASKAEQLCVLLFDVQVARYLTAMKLDQQVVAAQALSAARVAAEDLAPSPALSSRLCVQLAGSLHGYVSEVMLATEAHEAEDSNALKTLTDPLSTAFELLTKVKAQHRDQQQAAFDSSNVATTPGPGAAGAKAGGASALLQQVLQLESKVLLATAFCHFNFGGDPEACLRCIDALRQLETPESWSHPAVALLAMQAFLATRNTQQAETEAAGVAVNDGADVATCTAIILELLQAPVHMPEALTSVLELVLGRFPSDPSILLTFTERALKAATTAATAAATAATIPDAAATTINSSSNNMAYALQLEQLVLQVLESHEGPCAAVKADQELSSKLHVLLYNHGVVKFDGKSFEAAVKFFTASLDFAEDAVKATVSRVLVTCHLMLRQHTRAANYCRLAESYQPCVVATSFLRFKLMLLQGDEEGVLSEVSHMIKCSDFTPSMLHLACQEALVANAVPAARTALFKLLAILQEHQRQQQAASAAEDTAMDIDAGSKTGSSSSGQVAEGWVLRALVKLDSDEIERHMKTIAAETEAVAAAAAADEGASDTSLAGAVTTGKETAAAQTLQQQQQAGDTADADVAAAEGQPATTAAAAAASLAAATAAAAKCAVQLSEVVLVAVSRVKVLGVEVFSGDKESEGCRLLEWISSMAWNAALQITGLGDYQAVAVLMHGSAELLGLLPAIGPQHMKQQRLAYLMAAAAALEVHNSLPNHSASLKLAKKMCTAAKGASSRLLSGAAGGPTVAGGPSEAFLLQMQFRVAMQQQNTSEQLSLVQQLVDHPAVSPDLMHKVADLAHKHTNRCPEVVSAALEGVWRKLMACSSPDWDKVSEVMRRLVQQAGSDTEKLRLYRESSSIVTMLPKGSFPERELSWLVSTAWNTGLHHARFARHSDALDYMGVALSLLPCCTPACGISSSQRAMMTKAQAEQKRLAGAVACSIAVVGA